MSILHIINFYLDQAVEEKVTNTAKTLHKQYEHFKAGDFSNDEFRDSNIDAAIDFMD
jgi:hypothetical protein